jgi:hypothetical protein
VTVTCLVIGVPACRSAATRRRAMTRDPGPGLCSLRAAVKNVSDCHGVRVPALAAWPPGPGPAAEHCHCPGELEPGRAGCSQAQTVRLPVSSLTLSRTTKDSASWQAFKLRAGEVTASEGCPQPDLEAAAARKLRLGSARLPGGKSFRLCQ